jgi:hypothetical protein
MDWIKTKYDRAILLAAIVLLIASAVFVFLKTKSFGETFTSYFAPYTKITTFKGINVDPIDEAKKATLNPAKWKKQEKTVFVGVQYLLTKDAKLVEFRPEMQPIHEGMSNKWFIDNNIDLLASDAPEQDPDGDHFTNREEYSKGVASTDPNDPKSHPPLSDKLRLAKFIKIPFRLIFKVRDGDTMQINTVDLRQPSQFLTVGNKIEGTKFEIIKLDKKQGVNSLGIDTDVSEATIRNIETKAEIILVLGVIADSPDTYALFKYLYDNTEFKVKKDGDFQLKPDDKTTYKLIDINNNEAVITNTATGAKITIPKL